MTLPLQTHGNHFSLPWRNRSADPLEIRGFDHDMALEGAVEVERGALGPIWKASLVGGGGDVICFGIRPRATVGQATLRSQVTDRLRQLATVVHPNLMFPLGLAEVDGGGLGLVYQWCAPKLENVLNLCPADFLLRRGDATLRLHAPGIHYSAHSGRGQACCWGLIGAVDGLAVDPDDPYTAPELVEATGRAIPTDATEVYSLAAVCAIDWYGSTDVEAWEARPNDHHMRPLLAACLSTDPAGRPDLATALRGMMAEDKERRGGWLPVHLACMRDEVDFLRSYLDAGGDVEARTTAVHSGNVKSLLKIACDHGSEACVKLLLERGADPTADNILWGAADEGYVGVISSMVEAGANISADDFFDIENPVGFEALLDGFKGDDEEVAGSFLPRWGWHPACAAVLIRRDAVGDLFDGADERWMKMIETARAFVEPGTHPLDRRQLLCDELDAAVRRPVCLSSDFRSILVPAGGEGCGDDEVSETAVSIPACVHVYSSRDMSGGSGPLWRDPLGVATQHRLYGLTDVAVTVVGLPATAAGVQDFVAEVAALVKLSCAEVIVGVVEGCGGG